MQDDSDRQGGGGSGNHRTRWLSDHEPRQAGQGPIALLFEEVAEGGEPNGQGPAGGAVFFPPPFGVRAFDGPFVSAATILPDFRDIRTQGREGGAAYFVFS